MALTTAESDWTQSLREKIRAACVWEVTARKPGNVHPQAAFADVRFEDFIRSADVTAPVLAETQRLGVGRAIREAVSVTCRAVGRNTNLGIILLVAPLAAVPRTRSLSDGIEDVLAGLTVDDAADCYAAIREAKPGGLGRAEAEDVETRPTVTLREAMRLGADRDRIAAQYANGFRDVLGRGFDVLERYPMDPADAASVEQSAVGLHLHLMAALPDTLIARKCGNETADDSAQRARRVLDAGWPSTDEGRQEIQRLDEWLRADGNRRNPGTTADFVAAILFAALRDNRIALP